MSINRLYDDDIERLQGKALADRIKSLEDKVKTLQVTAVSAGSQLIPPIVNYARNSDFNYADGGNGANGGYRNTFYNGPPNSKDVCAHWYARNAATATAFTENGAASDANALLNDATKVSYWNLTGGYIQLGNNNGLACPLPKNLATPGINVYIRLQAALASGGSLTSTHKLKASIWDNTAGQLKTVESAPFNLTAAKVGAHTGGTTTRRYILRVDTASTFFYSQVSVAGTSGEVLNTVPTASIDNNNYVSVSWSAFQEAQTYTLYRYDSDTTLWHTIAIITNGALTFFDKGGNQGATITAPSQVNLKAEAYVSNFGGSLSNNFRDVLLTIRVPTLYNYGNTTDKQWLRLDIVDFNNNYVTISDRVLLIDKVGVSYTSGRWTPAHYDQDVTAGPSSGSPPASSGGGGTAPPSDGRGFIDCFLGDTNITCISPSGAQFQKPAYEVTVGDRLLTVAPDGSAGASEVEFIHWGTTSLLYTLYTANGKIVRCSPSHPLLTGFADVTGKAARFFRNGDTVLTYAERAEESVIAHIETIEQTRRVLTFQLREQHTFITNGIVSHNLAFKY